jgi:hypothetical protein
MTKASYGDGGEEMSWTSCPAARSASTVISSALAQAGAGGTTPELRYQQGFTF